MPTDEQRMREKFNEWLAERGYLPDHIKPWLGWDDGWLARDAEVQALKKELGQLIDAIAVEKDTWTEADADNLQGRVQSARAALAGGETGEAE